MKYKKIEIASQDRIDKYGDKAHKFIEDVFGFEEALLTDESSVYDFDFDLDIEEKLVEHHTEEYVKKIEYLYGVDVSDLDKLLIVDILDRIFKKS